MPVAFEQEFPFGTVIVKEHHPGTFEVTVKPKNFKPIVQLENKQNEVTILFDATGRCNTDKNCNSGYTICCADCTIDDCPHICYKVSEGSVLDSEDCQDYSPIE